MANVGASTPAAAPAAAAATPYTQATWATAVLTDANLPTTPTNVQNIERWMAAEEPPSNWWDRNNPLNASLGTSASDGTGSYPNLSAGAAYTAKMLQQSNMSGIYNALKENASPSVFSAAVVASPWASSHYGGNPNHIATIPVPTAVAAGVYPYASGASAAGGVDPGLGPSSGSPCQSAGCFFGFTVPSAAGILFGGGHQGCVCLMTQSQWKAVTGAFCVASGVLLAGFGVVLLASAVGKSTGATAAVKKAGSAVGIGGSLLAGQPEVAAGIAAKSKSSAPKAPPVPKIEAPAAPSTPEPRPVGRVQSRQIERRYQSAQRQQGPIGPRGGNPTATRIAQRERSGVSSPGPRRREPPNVRGGGPF